MNCEICHRTFLGIPVLHQFSSRVGMYCPACADEYGISDNYSRSICGCRACAAREELQPA